METMRPIADPQASAASSLSSASATAKFQQYYLLGLWAANELRMDDSDAAQYASEIARYGERTANDEAVVNVVRADIAAYNGDIGAPIIWKCLHRFGERSALETVPVLFGSRHARAA